MGNESLVAIHEATLKSIGYANIIQSQLHAYCDFGKAMVREELIVRQIQKYIDNLLKWTNLFEQYNWKEESYRFAEVHAKAEVIQLPIVDGRKFSSWHEAAYLKCRETMMLAHMAINPPTNRPINCKFIKPYFEDRSIASLVKIEFAELKKTFLEKPINDDNAGSIKKVMGSQVSGEKVAATVKTKQRRNRKPILNNFETEAIQLWRNGIGPLKVDRLIIANSKGKAITSDGQSWKEGTTSVLTNRKGNRRIQAGSR